MTRDKGNLIIPTVADVQAFCHSIGVSRITITPGYEKWWNVLHEIGHFAVKPDGYIALWRQNGGLGVPQMNWFNSNGVVKPDDPTPDEWGARAWCLLALEFNGWVSPLDCGKWPASNDWEGRSRNNPYLWMRNQVTSPRHPFHKNGFEQLEAVGIDFSRGILRPTQELVTVGWQPVLGWHSRQSA
ncbi:hypothetical protein NDI44_25605 [Trichocoleus sp. DQ-A3]|uniref:hypothetical protein n=1 Tax=Cyanophyceae TaxID=3028117 RepID=UPI001683A2EB|nr:hypothetical protein [Coleofasciculus sp. FACHB-125]MBD1901379.1 hypothetical protein [Coleofasciculus sp. FACHB-125]